MGWWKMGANGGISGYLDAPHQAEEPLFMGDGPADVMDAFLCDAEKMGFRPTKEVLTKALIEGDYNGIPDGEIHDAVFTLSLELATVWRESWGRNPYPAELTGCMDFSMHSMHSNVDEEAAEILEALKTAGTAGGRGYLALVDEEAYLWPSEAAALADAKLKSYLKTWTITPETREALVASGEVDEQDEA